MGSHSLTTYAIRYRDHTCQGWTRLIRAGNASAALYQFMQESAGVPVWPVSVDAIHTAERVLLPGETN